MASVSRYHPVLVAMHWLLALLITAALALGALVMARTPNTDPMKIEALRAHMGGGILIVSLMPCDCAAPFELPIEEIAMPASAPVRDRNGRPNLNSWLRRLQAMLTASVCRRIGYCWRTMLTARCTKGRKRAFTIASG